MIIDLHCDTILRLYEDKSRELRQNDYHIDINRLKASNTWGQFFAFFIDGENIPRHIKDGFAYFTELYVYFHSILLENEQDITLTTSLNQYKENQRNNKISAFLTIEGGEGIGHHIENLKTIYDKGIRLITLTWNHPNKIGYPNTTVSYMKQGLTSFGHEVVEEMNRLGMLIDVSHLSDQGFYDVAARSTKPFVASHSNARAIMSHRRNLTDEMIKILSEKGGVMGMNYYSHFISDNKISRIEDIVKHIKHIHNVAGIDVIALGSDFDGIDCQLEFEDVSGVPKILHALSKEGFSDDDIDKIAYKNAERILQDI